MIRIMMKEMGMGMVNLEEEMNGNDDNIKICGYREKSQTWERGEISKLNYRWTQPSKAPKKSPLRNIRLATVLLSNDMKIALDLALR